MILDPEAEKDKVQSFVQDLLSKLEGLKQRSITFKNYQKNFKVEVTKFEELDDTYSEVRLKQLLWESQKEWETMYEDWMKVSRRTRHTHILHTLYMYMYIFYVKLHVHVHVHVL